MNVSTPRRHCCSMEADCRPVILRRALCAQKATQAKLKLKLKPLFGPIMRPACGGVLRGLICEHPLMGFAAFVKRAAQKASWRASIEYPFATPAVRRACLFSAC